MPEKERRLLKFAEYLATCSKEASDYGKCVTIRAEKVGKGDCQAEFERLLYCFKKNKAKALNK
uniref:NADH dehydrogenase [ubiquinone] 1 alpha subcomplex assembly factor 8 n=1 Tax=Meloidogyne hapla TaxID=6305 RepID=A0A1I8AZ58_MELHA